MDEYDYLAGLQALIRHKGFNDNVHKADYYRYQKNRLFNCLFFKEIPFLFLVYDFGGVYLEADLSRKYWILYIHITLYKRVFPIAERGSKNIIQSICVETNGHSQGSNPVQWSRDCRRRIRLVNRNSEPREHKNAMTTPGPTVYSLYT